MSLRTQIADDLDTVFSTADFGVSVTTSAGATITGLIDYGQDLAQYQANGQASLATLQLRKEDVSDPVRYNYYVIDSTTWRVEQVNESNGFVWNLLVTADRRLS